MSQKKRQKDLKRTKKKTAHEKYLKSLFTKHGWGLKVTSKREAPGNLYYTELEALKTAKAELNDNN